MGKIYKLELSRLRLFALVLLTGALLMSCEKNSPEPGNNNPALRKLNPLEKELIRNNNNFALDLLQSVTKSEPQENIFISPFSVGMALGMTYNGSGGETQQEIKHTLGISLFDQNELDKTFNELMSTLQVMDQKVDLDFANSMWFSDGLKINEPSRSKIMAYYDAEVKELRFGHESSAHYINKWVNLKTLGKIPQLVDSIPARDQIDIINAVYFQASWLQPFDANLTTKEKFNLGNGKSVDVPVMHGINLAVRYFTDNDLTYLELPFGKGQFRLVLLMPNNKMTPEILVQKLDASSFADLVKNADSTNLNVGIPRFNIEFKDNLSTALQSLGVHKAFSVDADFKNLFPNDPKIYVSAIDHQAVIQIDEKGMDPVFLNSSTLDVEKLPFDVTFNRPFVFFIRENHTNAILFSGILRNPA